MNHKNIKKPKALVMLSGGLDSRLALMIMKDQLGAKNIQAIFFILPFGAGCCNEHCSLNFCQTYGMRLKIVDCTRGKNLQEYIEIIKKPKFGYGKGMNPCIDCRIFMLKKAKEYADKNNIDIIVTGEVLDERPMSQRKAKMELIENEAGLKGKILRPLSAKLLEETDAEKSGLIDREKLFSIQGRQRKKQIELAGKYKINYPTPAGGCLLCEKEFVERLKPLLDKGLNEEDVFLLKIGRHFNNSEIILGRNREENEKIEAVFKRFKRGILIVPKGIGPSAYIKDKKLVEKAKALIRKYSKHEIEEFEVTEGDQHDL